MSKFPLRRKREGGFILITLYLLLVICLAHATAMITHSFAELRGSQRFEAGNRAFYLAESGIDQAIRWLGSQGTPPTGTAALVLNGGWQTLGEGFYLSTVDPDDGNPTSFTKRYTLEGWGAGGQQASPTSLRRVRYIMQTESFSRYAYFTNSDTSVAGATLWFITGDHIEGPTHTNGQLNMYGTPIFDGLVTSVSSSLNQWGGGPPTTNPTFNGGLQLGASTVTMPTVIPTTLSSAASSGGRLFSGATSITLLNNGTMSVTNASSGMVNQVLSLPGNGVVYVQGGDVTLQGTLKGQLTIATDQTVKVANSITYSDSPLTNPDSTDLLGIVAGKNVTISSSAPTNVNIDASIMALSSSFGVENYNVAPAKGTLTVNGGIIQKNRGPVGTFNASTGLKASGYTKSYHYDTRLKSMIPPYFPTTGNYSALVWEEQS